MEAAEREVYVRFLLQLPPGRRASSFFCGRKLVLDDLCNNSQRWPSWTYAQHALSLLDRRGRGRRQSEGVSAQAEGLERDFPVIFDALAAGALTQLLTQPVGGACASRCCAQSLYPCKYARAPSLATASVLSPSCHPLFIPPTRSRAQAAAS